MKSNSPFTKLLRTSAIGFFISAGISFLLTFIPFLSMMLVNTLLSTFIGFFLAGILLNKETPKKWIAVAALVTAGMSILLMMVINVLFAGGASLSFGMMIRCLVLFQWRNLATSLLAFFLVSVYAVYLPCNYVLSGYTDQTMVARFKRMALIGVAILLISSVVLVLSSDSNKTAEEKWKEQMTDILEEYSEYKGGFY